MTVWLTVLTMVLGGGGVASAAEPTVPQDLAKLVPSTVVILVRATDLGQVWAGAKQGGLAERLKATEAWKRFAASDEHVKMLTAQAELDRLYQFNVEQALVDVLGKEVVVAADLEGVGPRQPTGYLLLARAVSAERLKSVAERLRRIRTDTGELKSSVEQPYRGLVIYDEVSVPKRGKDAGREKTSRYCLVGDLLIAGERMGPVKAAIDRLLEPNQGSLADSPRYRQALASLPAGCAVTAYVDAAALVAAAPPTDAQTPPGLRRLLLRADGFLAALDTVAFGLGVQEDLQVAVRTRFNEVKLPLTAADLLRTESTAQNVWHVLPASTVLVLAARTDLPKVVAFVREQMLPAAAQQQFDVVKQNLGAAFGGLDFEQRVLPELGPEVALVVSRVPVAGAANPPTVRGLAASLLIEVGNKDEIAGRLQSAVGALAWAAVTGNNKVPTRPKLVLAVEVVSGVSVTYVDFEDAHPLRGTLSPCCAKVGDFVVVSTSRAAMKDLIAAAGGAPGLAQSADFQRHVARFGGKASGLLYLNAAQLAGALHDNRAAILAQPRKAGETAAQAQQNFDGLLELLGLLDGLSAARSVAPGRISATITVTPAPPAK
jgi:hypothetical protein